MDQIIFIQTKFPSDFKAFQSLASRWNGYGELVQKEYGGVGIELFTTYPMTNIEEDLFQPNYIRKLPVEMFRENSLGRILAFGRYVKTSNKSVCLVCGDNQQSLLIAMFVKVRFRSRTRIHIQFHGDTYSFSVNKGIRGFVRACLSRIGIYLADSIRIVSEFQKEEISAISKSANSKLVLSPIPIDVSRISRNSVEKNVDLAFVGRLHPERGVTELIQIVQALLVKNPKLSVLIAGDGPLRPKLECELRQFIEKGSVRLTGFLDNNEILNLFGSTKALVSPAPLEGYGLTLREAILSGVQVIARTSKGAREAQESFPGRIDTYSDIFQAVDLIQNALVRVNPDIHPKYLQNQLRSDSEGLHRLIESWLRI